MKWIKKQIKIAGKKPFRYVFAIIFILVLLNALLLSAVFKKVEERGGWEEVIVKEGKAIKRIVDRIKEDE